MAELNYKASNIAKAERESGKKFFDTFNQLEKGIPSFDSLLFMLEAGGMAIDKADVLIKEKGIAETLVLVVEAVVDAGFLGKAKVDTKKMRQTVLENAKQENSSTSGVGKKV